MNTPHDNSTSLNNNAQSQASVADGERGACAPATGMATVDAPRLVMRGESLGEVVEGVDISGEALVLLVGRGDSTRLMTLPLPKVDGNPFAAITDYLNVSFPFTGPDNTVTNFLTLLRSRIGDSLGGLSDRGRGLHGYLRSFVFDNGKAMFAYGGQAGTAFFSLPGEACALIPDWHGLVELVRDELKGRITRWDGAVDDYEGQYNVDHAVDCYKSGGFNAGGNKPSCSQAGNWIEEDGKGRTFYVGRRENGKYMRIYEKGKQLGSTSSPWVRWELELHNTGRIIPFEVLLEPGRYVSGAYPCLGWIKAEASRIKTIQKTTVISYKHLAHYLRVAYGPMVNTMMEVEGCAEKVIEMIRRPGLPKRLDLPVIPKGEGFKR